MKRSRLVFNIIVATLMWVGMDSNLYAQEEIVFDGVIDWEWYRPQPYGGNGFYWWHAPTEGGATNYGDMSSTDWKSPHNYEHGEFFLRFEVLEQPSSVAFKIQLGIWQDRGGDYRETVSWWPTISGGAGSYVEESLGKPTGWYEVNSSKPVDWTRPEDFYRIGMILWKDSPACIPLAQGWTNGSACSNPESTAALFFPMVARVTVVAVASGHTFSGWENYGSGEKPPTPNYSVDYTNEQTSQPVSALDEYSTNEDMSGATSGSDQRIDLTPGENMYFRTKAEGGNPASDVQTLVVKNRPSIPAFTIDYSTERTSETVSGNYEYDSQSDFMTPTIGGGMTVGIPPQTNIYFRKLAGENDFMSDAQHISSGSRPDAPFFTISYINESTAENVGSEYEYSTSPDFLSFSTGNGSQAALEPAVINYFRYAATGSAYSSELQALDVPARPPAPNIGLNFITETTEEIPAGHIYSYNEDLSNSQPGNGQGVPLAPGNTVYIRRIASDTTFGTEKQVLTAPDRPDGPDFTIDYVNETTMEIIPATVIYDTDPNFETLSFGAGASIPVTPGIPLYFKSLATESQYVSEAKQLTIPERDTPTFGINYKTESTSDPLSSQFMVSDNADMSGAVAGTGAAYQLTPGTSLFIKELASALKFSSNIQELQIPARPALSTPADPASESPIPVNIQFPGPVNGFEGADISVSNGSVESLIGTYTASIVPLAEGNVMVFVPADVVDEGNFTSFPLSFQYKLPTGVGLNGHEKLVLYPSPASDLIYLNRSENESALNYEIIDLTGMVVDQGKLEKYDNTIGVSELKSGLYFARFMSEETGLIRIKFVKE